MAKAAWNLALKEICGTPDLDTVKKELEVAHTAILEIQSQIRLVSSSLVAGRKAIDGVVLSVEQVVERLCVVERKCDDFLSGAVDLDASICRLREECASQEGLIESVEQRTKLELQGVGEKVFSVQEGLASTQETLKKLEGRLCALESRVDELRGKGSGPKGPSGPPKSAL